MKVGIISILTALLLALPAFAGPTDPCADPSGLPDADVDGVRDECDNCSAEVNAGQQDFDFDGFGNACDCDFDNDASTVCDGSDFLIFGAAFNSSGPPATVPPADPNTDMTSDGFVDGSDFLLFGKGFNSAVPGKPGPACGQALGVPCPPPVGP